MGYQIWGGIFINTLSTKYPDCPICPPLAEFWCNYNDFILAQSWHITSSNFYGNYIWVRLYVQTWDGEQTKHEHLKRAVKKASRERCGVCVQKWKMLPTKTSEMIVLTEQDLGVGILFSLLAFLSGHTCTMKIQGLGVLINPLQEGY